MPDNWRSIELKHLRALRAVAETGTFWAASEQLNASLSTGSDHVSALETLVGVRLIERSRGRRIVQLTEAGRGLLGHAEAIESRLRAARADFRAYAAGGAGSLRIVISRSVRNKAWPEVEPMVAAGLGFALAPYLAVDEADARIRLLQLAEPVPPRVLIIVWHRDRYRAPASAAFVETAVSVAVRIERAHDAFLTKALGLGAPRATRRPARARRSHHPASRPA